MLQWVEECALLSGQEDQTGALPGILRPSRLHIRCVTATLWKTAQLNLFDVSSLFTQLLFEYVNCSNISLNRVF